MIKKIYVKVPATTANLGPGFDILGAALTLYNELEVTIDESHRCGTCARPFIEIHGEGKDSLPRDGTNIVWRSMKTVFTRSKQRSFPKVVGLKQTNHIPLAAGLGSSAAARLCGILAANAMCGGALSAEEVLELGVRLEGHPDNIIPALVGGLCIAYKNGESFHFYKLPAPRLKAVVCTPNFELPTAEARRVLPKKVSLEAAVFNASRLALLVAALAQGKYEILSSAMQDRLHQPFRARLIPGMYEVFEAAIKVGARGAALSGAGPSLIALASASKATIVGKKMQEKWMKRNIASRTFIMGFDHYGSKVGKRGGGS